MSSPQLPPTAIPKPLADDDDDVSWALQTAAVQWGRGAYQDALVWLRRAAESAIELNAWSRGADLNASATRLDKLLGQSTSSPPSSIPVGPASVRPGPSSRPLPSFPVPPAAPTTSPAPAPIGKRVTAGYSAFPPSSLPPDSLGSPRSSVVIDDIREAELDLSEDELRELEAGADSVGIPDGHRGAGSSASFPVPSAEPLPAFALEPSSPLTSRPSRPLPGYQDHSRELPAFPLETGVSSLPPYGGPLPSSLPPSPLHSRGAEGFSGSSGMPPLPNIEDDSDDGAPGLYDIPVARSGGPPSFAEVSDDDLQADEIEIDSVEEIDDAIETLAPPPAPEPVRRPGAPPTPPPPNQPARRPSNLPRLPIRPGAASMRPRESVTPLPPATTFGDRRSSSRFPVEPRLPDRRPTSQFPTSPPDIGSPVFGAEPGYQSTEAAGYAQDSGYPEDLSVQQRRSGRAPQSGAPTERRIEVTPFPAAERNVEGPRSVPPPSARGLEPEDLPTVSSPNVSSQPMSLRPSVPPISEYPRSMPVAPVYTEPSYAEEGAVASAPPPSMPFEPQPAPEMDALLAEDVASMASNPAYDGTFDALPASPGAEVWPENVEPLTELPEVASSTPAAAEGSTATLMGVRLAEVRGFSELPATALERLAQCAQIERLDTGEEASLFSVALVLDGWVSLMPAIADSACATAVVGEVVFTEGTLDIGMMLRVVAGQDQVIVATWDSAAIAEATAECPWVADDLKLLADGFQALAGACLGPLGDRLDDSLRSIVTSRCEIRTLLPGEQLCAPHKPVPGMHIVGGGEIELVDESGRVTKTHGTGEFLFATQVLAGGGVPFTARAGSHGALVLFAPRMAAHELLVSVPPLLEILAE